MYSMHQYVDGSCKCGYRNTVFEYVIENFVKYSIIMGDRSPREMVYVQYERSVDIGGGFSVSASVVDGSTAQ